VQAFQLVRGGREPALRLRGTCRRWLRWARADSFRASR
jgi:glutamine synthetase adenylyltransferase